MDWIYLGFVIFLFILAVSDLWVGVSNDAVNFLNSAIGAKVAKFRTIIIVAATGVFLGAIMSNGMMDIARHGIFRPEQFAFNELMYIFLAVMVTDIILLDVFNSLGMPTSTTVSMVFELLGATFALAIIKMAGDDTGLGFADYMNTEKALSVIMAIFVSVAIAFVCGSLIQYIARLIFSFDFHKGLTWKIGIYGGIATTAIVYFMLFKGTKDLAFMTDDVKTWISDHTWLLLGGCLLFFTILMQVLHFLKVNVFKVIVLIGTFALAMAFAGNDLVNFIGVPLAGYSSYCDLMAQGGTTTTDTFLMTSLLEPAQTPWYFLIGAGIVMVIALLTSKKAHNVVKTSLDLSRQSEGEESFGTSPVARVLVRTTTNMAMTITSVIPEPVKVWLNKRFDSSEMIMENKASFDLVRASVNVVLSGLLIAVGTSLKLPLSTTYVAFMVAMGSSLADRAWGRESAVFRITGVLSVIGGWFITAGAAFTICFVVTLVIYWGGTPAIIAMVGLAIYSLVRSQLAYKKKMRKEALKEEVNNTVAQLQKANTPYEALQLFRKHSREELTATLRFASDSLESSVTAFTHENLRELRKTLAAIEEKKIHLKQVKRVGTLGVTQLEHDIAVEKGLYYYQSNDFASEIVFSIRRLAEPCKEHIDNNFNPLSEVQKNDFGKVVAEIKSYLMRCADMVEHNDYDPLHDLIVESARLSTRLTQLKKEELKRIQGQQGGSTKVSMVYLNMLQEAANVVAFSCNLIKVSHKFQQA